MRSNIRLVYKLSWPFHKRYGGEIDDYVQEGLLGFLLAVDRFDTAKGMRLGVYATHWVKAYLRNYVFRNTSTVKFWTTNKQRTLFFALPHAQQTLATRLGRTPKLEEVAVFLAVGLEELQEIVSHLKGDVSLNMPASEREDGPQHDMIDNLVCSEDSPEERAIKQDQAQFLRRELRAALNTSGAREQFVLESRFLDEATPTLAELGAVLNVSREYIRQLEQQGLKKLQKKLRHIKKKTT